MKRTAWPCSSRPTPEEPVAFEGQVVHEAGGHPPPPQPGDLDGQVRLEDAKHDDESAAELQATEEPTCHGQLPGSRLGQHGGLDRGIRRGHDPDLPTLELEPQHRLTHGIRQAGHRRRRGTHLLRSTVEVTAQPTLGVGCCAPRLGCPACTSEAAPS